MTPSRRLDLLVTYRYLRGAIIVLIVMLAASIVIQWRHAGTGCWENSISAYYYTPARGVFVSMLVAIGVCVIAIRGTSDVEDILLNLGGMVAPLIAFVPSSPEGLCASTSATAEDRSTAVANNVGALLVAGLVALVAVGVLTWLAHRRRRLPPHQPAGVVVAWVLFLAVTGWFWLGRDSFERAAHYAAAAVFFLCIIAVAVADAVSYAREHPATRWRGWPVNRYSVIAAAMVVLPAVMGLVSLAVTWDHAPFFIEATLIVLFGAFWIAQSIELWRGTPTQATTEPTSARS